MADVWFVTLKINIKMIFIDFFFKRKLFHTYFIFTLYYFIRTKKPYISGYWEVILEKKVRDT